MQPAPIQAHFLGDLGTMGADFIQYHFATLMQVPEEHLPYYSENIVYLPETIVAIKQHVVPDIMPTRKEYGLPEDKIVFCCFNNHYRIDEQTFTAWMNILKAVPNSVLWLSSNNKPNIIHLHNHAKAHIVDPNRLIFKAKSFLNHDWHLRLADIYLDTFVISGCTTNLLSLWVGLPVISLLDKDPHGRIGASINNSLNIKELIVHSPAEYCNTAIELALNKDKREAIRQKILLNKATSPLFDQRRLIKHLECAYELMYADHKSGNKKKTINVPTINS